MSDLAPFIASGLTRGSIYALVGRGFAIVFNASNVINFAQGEFVMLGSMLVALLVTTTGLLPSWAAVPLVVMAAGALGAALYGLAIRPAVRAGRMATLIIITLGASILVRGVVQVVLGKQDFMTPSFSGETPVQVLGASISTQSLWVFGTLVVTVLVLKWFFDVSVLGRAMRATAQSPLAASLVGIDVGRILMASFALGAYGAALLTTRAGLHPLLAVLVTAVAVGALAFVAARPILRLRGHYLAVATLGLGIIISIVLNREVWLTAGLDGLTIPAITLFGARLRSQLLWYGVVAGLLVLTVWLAENLVHSPAGRALAALHSSEIAASTAGIDVARAKAVVFTLSAVIACVAGAVFVFAGRFVTPADASFLRSTEFITMIVLGGLASSYGAIVGALVLTVLPQVFAPLADYTTIVLGLGLGLTMIFLPRGVVPSLATWLRRRAA